MDHEGTAYPDNMVIAGLTLQEVLDLSSFMDFAVRYLRQTGCYPQDIIERAEWLRHRVEELAKAVGGEHTP